MNILCPSTLLGLMETIETFAVIQSLPGMQRYREEMHVARHLEAWEWMRGLSSYSHLSPRYSNPELCEGTVVLLIQRVGYRKEKYIKKLLVLKIPL